MRDGVDLELSLLLALTQTAEDAREWTARPLARRSVLSKPRRSVMVDVLGMRM